MISTIILSRKKKVYVETWRTAQYERYATVCTEYEFGRAERNTAVGGMSSTKNKNKTSRARDTRETVHWSFPSESSVKNSDVVTGAAFSRISALMSGYAAQIWP